MGLLDSMDSDQFRLGLGLLAAGGARGDGAGFGQRMAEGFGYMDKFKSDKKKAEFEQLKVEEYKRKVKQEEAQAMEQERIKTLLRGAGRPLGGTNQVNAALPPDLQIGAQNAIPQQIDAMELIRQGVPYAQVKELFDAKNLGRDEVARVVDVEGPNGTLVKQGYDKWGAPQGQGVSGYVAPQLINQGNKQTYAKPMIGASFPMGMSPSEQSAANDRNRSFGLQQQRFEFDKGAQITDAGGPSQAPLVKLFGRPESGFRWKPDGSSEPIPGGSKDLKAGELGAKTDARKQSGIAQANVVLGTVQEANDLVGMSTAGYGSWLAGMPNTDARNLAGKLTTIKANLGFDRLQQMREQSPTGGALGQVAVQELTALQATVASLDQGQTPAQLKTALDKIEKHYNNWTKTLGGGEAEPTSAKPTMRWNPKTRTLEMVN